ncbi:MAG: hypothetical protein HY695_30140 [Deltaproteobacteria bacterium]|nr:hypothetical protein [Deltaproteobacteria bacterium]
MSHWKEHCELLANMLTRSGKTPSVLTGTLGKKRRSAILGSIKDISTDKELLIIATGQYLGEGFDCPQVDTLFLAFPLSFRLFRREMLRKSVHLLVAAEGRLRGKLTQYVGRALRSHQGKNSVIVYDYVDTQVPVLRKMFAKRQKTYKLLRFLPEDAQTKILSKAAFHTGDRPIGFVRPGS